MSTLKVTNIQATGETATRAVSGVAAAWCNLNGTGTVAIRDSTNMSSVTDLNVGYYTFNMSNDMANSNYASDLSNSRASTIGNPPGYINMYTNNITGLDFAPTTTSFSVGLLDYGVGGRDVTFVCVSTHGDLA